MSDSKSAGLTPLVWWLLALTATTGLVDAVSFLGLGHVFTANMTGNVVFLGFALAGEGEVAGLRSLVAIAAFATGALLGGRIANAMIGSTHRRWLGLVTAVEVSLLLAAAFVASGYDPGREEPEAALLAIVVATALAMGLRNATAVRLADPDLKTTVLTLTITGLAADSALAGGTSPRWARRALSVVALGAGAAAGAALLRTTGMSGALLAMAAMVAAATALYARHPASATLSVAPRAG